MSEDNVPWSSLYEARQEIQKRYRSIWDVPIAKRYSKVLFDLGSDGVSILEIGAGTKGLAKKIAKVWPNATYKSLDIDTTQAHDFYSLDDVTGEYDFICMFDVIEHVRPAKAHEILSACKKFLKPGGRLCATTPNTFHPPTFLRDATHITPWCYDELGSLAIMSGFRVDELYRLYTDRLTGKLVHRVFLYPVHKALSIDFAKQIMIVASV
jgi:2-polyprenyl-3-methyl-5-hydroxy-6-metoxy-1,4-benzoquinol methylase